MADRELSHAEKVAKIVYATSGRGTTFGFTGIGSATSFANELISHERLLMTPKTLALDDATAGALANRLAKVWESDKGRMDRFSAQLTRDGTLTNRFKDLSPQAAARIFERYTPANAANLSSEVNAAYTRENPQARVVTAPRAPAPPPARAEPRPQPRSNPPAERPPTPSPTRSEGRERPSPPPATASTGAAPAPISAAAEAPVTTAAGNLSPDAAKLAFGKVIDSASKIFGDEFKPQEDALFGNPDANPPIIGRLDSDPALLGRLTNAMNSDPELLAQIRASGGQGSMEEMVQKFNEQTPETQVAIRNGLRNSYRNLLEDPTLIGQKEFRDGLASTAQSAGMQSAFGGAFGQIWESIKSFCGPFIQKIAAACQEMFGGGEGMSMFSGIGNGVSGLFGNLMGPGGALEGITGRPTQPIHLSHIDKDDGSQMQELSAERKAEQERALQNPPRQAQQGAGPQQPSPVSGPGGQGSSAAAAMGSALS